LEQVQVITSNIITVKPRLILVSFLKRCTEKLLLSEHSAKVNFALVCCE